MGRKTLMVDPAVDGVDGHAEVGGDLIDGVPPVTRRRAAVWDRHESLIVAENRASRPGIQMRMSGRRYRPQTLS